MKKLYQLVLVLLLVLPGCKKKKEKEFHDPVWRQESLEIARSICTKLESCVKDEFLKIKKELQSYGKSEIKPDKCLEKNKKSRVYLLKGNDPVRIKQIARDCNSQIQSFSCEEIKSGIILSSSVCEEMRKVQQGISF